ncbi:MAG: hypothetical protein HOI89_02050 [Phycisphaerae bacterium]|nr:hypothetical protein [Phycisphaerae bacterium]
MPVFLTEHTIAQANQVADDLRVALVRVLEEPTLEGQRAADLSRHLGVGRMTCQRINQLRRGGPEDANLLATLPGVSGLREFLSAVEQAGAPRASLTAAHAAVDAFERFLLNAELSQSQLSQAMTLHFEATDPSRQLARRTELYEAAAAVTGQSMDTTVSIMAVRFSEQANMNFEQIAIRGYSQIRASLSAMPIRLPMNAAFSEFRKAGGEEAAREPQELIEQFCTRPLPRIDRRVIKEANLAHIINPEHIPAGESFDCFASQHSRWNIRGTGEHRAIWLYVDYPTRHCTFDLYLDQRLAAHSIVTADCHLWGTALLAPPEDLWMTRFADQMTFTELGTGTHNAGSTSYLRHQELTEHLFESHGWNPESYVGYRCQMEMPIWRSGVCIVLQPRTEIE